MSKPPQDGDEIEAELADHLACLQAEESARGAGEAVAQEEALARFGDPRHLAQRLRAEALGWPFALRFSCECLLAAALQIAAIVGVWRVWGEDRMELITAIYWGVALLSFMVAVAIRTRHFIRPAGSAGGRPLLLDPLPQASLHFLYSTRVWCYSGGTFFLGMPFLMTILNPATSPTTTQNLLVMSCFIPTFVLLVLSAGLLLGRIAMRKRWMIPGIFVLTQLLITLNHLFWTYALAHVLPPDANGFNWPQGNYMSLFPPLTLAGAMLIFFASLRWALRYVRNAFATEQAAAPAHN